MVLHITDRYLWFPVSKANDEVKLHFYSENKKFQELDIKLTTDRPDFIFAMDMSSFWGQDIEIKSDPESGILKKLSCHSERPGTKYPYRPEIHFTAEAGWVNDPNGLVFADGVYHLYHQWNPYGTDWGNMHWGHAVSRDLITWEMQPMAMKPDEYGTIFSGCGWQDKKNTAGFGENALLFFYTASGGNNQWSIEKGNNHTQRLAISNDGGKTLQKKGLVLDCIKGENRDPKVFWHRESKSYVMVLFLDEYEFAIFRSTDVLHWEESQRFTAGKMRECPDLFELKVEDKQDVKKWVFWSADGYYMIGSFDGYRFVPESDVLSAYDTVLAYAAQTYAGVGDRVISVAWHRTSNDKGGFRGMMSIPAELSLRNTPAGLRISFQPVRELWERFTDVTELTGSEGTVEHKLSGHPIVAKIDWETKVPAVLQVGKTKIMINKTDVPTIVIIDHGLVEYFSENGLVYGAVETEENVLSKKVVVRSIKSMKVFSREGLS